MIEDLSEANKVTEILMGSDVAKRRNFIMENGDKAEINV